MFFWSTIRTLSLFTHPPLMRTCLTLDSYILYTIDWLIETLIDDLDWNIVWCSWLKYWLIILIEILIDWRSWLKFHWLMIEQHHYPKVVVDHVALIKHSQVSWYWWTWLKYWLTILIEILIDDRHWNIVWCSWLKYWLIILIEILIDWRSWLKYCLMI
jgi:hypothetical protein